MPTWLASVGAPTADGETDGVEEIAGEGEFDVDGVGVPTTFTLIWIGSPAPDCDAVGAEEIEGEGDFDVVGATGFGSATGEDFVEDETERDGELVGVEASWAGRWIAPGLMEISEHE